MALAASMRALALLLVASTATAVTPIEKVLNLIQDLKAEVETEGKAEAKTYDEFACFCKTKTMATSDAITGGQDNIDDLSASIEEKTTSKQDKTTELGENKKKLETLKKTLAEETVRCDKERAAYEMKEADLSKAISSLEGAQLALEGAKGANLLSVKTEVKKSLALAEAMQLVEEGPKYLEAKSFLQTVTKVDPEDPEYKYHSQGIIDLLDRLEQEFRGKKADVDAEWAKTSTECSNIKADLANQIELTEGAIDTLKTDIGTLTAEIGQARSDLVEAQSQLKDDQLYIKDLTAMCEKRAVEWDQRAQMRADELKMLTKALEILTSDAVAKTDDVNERALLQTASKPAKAAAKVAEKAAVAAPSFLQTRSMAVENKAAALRGALSEEAMMQMRKNNALQMLRKEGGRLGSTAISALAVRAAADPFKKVKELIQDLIERLLKEATQEATKKGFCDMELAKANQDRDTRLEEVRKLNAELKGLEAKEEELTLEIEDLTDALKDLKADLKEATDIRTQEKDENIKTLKEAKAGLQAVVEAIMIMKSFYKSAAKAEALVQIKESPVDQDTSGAGFDGAYKGKQGASTGIIGILEVIKSDYDRTIRTTTADEQKAQEEFTKFEQASKADIAGKTTKKELDEQDLEKTKSGIDTKMEDMKDNMNMADEALKTLEELKPSCIDTGMSYADRKAKREEEIEALKKAMCILDENKVEAECQQ